jgi:hypothetical protein
VFSHASYYQLAFLFSMKKILPYLIAVIIIGALFLEALSYNVFSFAISILAIIFIFNFKNICWFIQGHTENLSAWPKEILRLVSYFFVFAVIVMFLDFCLVFLAYLQNNFGWFGGCPDYLPWCL